jgi:hypothetical protein
MFEARGGDCGEGGGMTAARGGGSTATLRM